MMTQLRPALLENQKNIRSLIKTSNPDFSIKIASPDEKNRIIQLMLSKFRQTMNLRLMPTAQLLLLLDEKKNKTIAGWMGVDYQHDPRFPETFSLFIAPVYRNNHLSLALKQTVYSILYAQNIDWSYSRMEASHNQKLIDYNVSSGFYRVLPPDTINPDWKKMCLHCELHEKNCKSQVYLEANVPGIMHVLNDKLGNLPNTAFPKYIYLRPALTRNKNGMISFFPRWHLKKTDYV